MKSIAAVPPSIPVKTINRKSWELLISVCPVVIKNNISAKTLAKRLNKYGIQTRPFFWPMHKQTILRKMGLFEGEKYPNSEYLSKYGLYLPSSLSLNSKQISFISKKVNEIIK